MKPESGECTQHTVKVLIIIECRDRHFCSYVFANNKNIAEAPPTILRGKETSPGSQTKFIYPAYIFIKLIRIINAVKFSLILILILSLLF